MANVALARGPTVRDGPGAVAVLDPEAPAPDWPGPDELSFSENSRSDLTLLS